MLLSYLIKNSDFSSLASFISPHFFKVVPTAQLLKLVQKLFSNQKNHERWQALSQQLQAKIQRSGIQVNLAQPSSDRRPATNLHYTEQINEAILQLFFFQILNEKTWLLDLRCQSFYQLESQLPLQWSPSPFYLEISDEFLAGVRDLYIGFYLENETQFASGLRQLELSEVRENIERHFGSGDQTQVDFKLTNFQKTFASIFEACAERKISLRPEFFVLGTLLLGLYQNLEQLGLPVNVRSVFKKTLSLSLPQTE